MTSELYDLMVSLEIRASLGELVLLPPVKVRTGGSLPERMEVPDPRTTKRHPHGVQQQLHVVARSGGHVAKRELFPVFRHKPSNNSCNYI